MEHDFKPKIYSYYSRDFLWNSKSVIKAFSTNVLCLAGFPLLARVTDWCIQRCGLQVIILELLDQRALLKSLLFDLFIAYWEGRVHRLSLEYMNFKLQSDLKTRELPIRSFTKNRSKCLILTNLHDFVEYILQGCSLCRNVTWFRRE